jgi:hypothetical protein
MKNVNKDAQILANKYKLSLIKSWEKNNESNFSI